MLNINSAKHYSILDLNWTICMDTKLSFVREDHLYSLSYKHHISINIWSCEQVQVSYDWARTRLSNSGNNSELEIAN